jgi:hypothetical protein
LLASKGFQIAVISLYFKQKTLESRDKRFKAWGSEFDESTSLNVKAKPTYNKPVTKIKFFFFRIFLSIKTFITTLLD